MIFNNIRIENSTIGLVNTGMIKRADVAITNLQESGSSDLAAQLPRLVEAVLKAEDLGPEKKEEAVELIGALADEAASPETKRRRSVGKALMGQLVDIVNLAGSLASIWQVVEPLLSRALHLQ